MLGAPLQPVAQDENHEIQAVPQQGPDAIQEVIEEQKQQVNVGGYREPIEIFDIVIDYDLEIDDDEDSVSSSSDEDAELDHLDIAGEGPIGQGAFHDQP